MTTTDSDFAPTIDSDIVCTSATATPQRLLSLDVLRGLTIAFMILVNDQVGPKPFSQLVHANWNGFTATDLVFPTFLLLVGLSTVLSTAARLERGATRTQLFLHTCRRALLLILFGFVVNNFPFFHMATARYYGVLPRIAVCYFVVAILYLVSPTWKDKVVIALFCLISYWALMRFVSVPGYGIPTHAIPMNDRDANIAAWLDRQIFRAPHLYERTRDPEGLLSTLPSIATALFGLLSGMWLRTNRSTARKTAMLALAGLLFLVVALAWNPYVPINKKLWTSSFALFAGGWSLLLMALTMFAIDLRHLGRPRVDSNRADRPSHPLLYQPFLVLGTNAILAYMISELGDSILRAIHVSGTTNLKQAASGLIIRAVPHLGWASLLYSAAYLLICWLLVLPFYRKRIFLRI